VVLVEVEVVVDVLVEEVDVDVGVEVVVVDEEGFPVVVGRGGSWGRGASFMVVVYVPEVDVSRITGGFPPSCVPLNAPSIGPAMK